MGKRAQTIEIGDEVSATNSTPAAARRRKLLFRGVAYLLPGCDRDMGNSVVSRATIKKYINNFLKKNIYIYIL